MADMKRCIQCGLLKNVEEFRRYTYAKEKDTDGRYRLCKQCEATNTTYRKICKQLDTFKDEVTGDFSFTPSSKETFYRLRKSKERIEMLYDMLAARGLRVPTKKVPDDPNAGVLGTVDKLFAMYGETPNATTVTATVIATPDELPDELQAWLDADPAEWQEKELSPEYLQETIYESLKAKYRPQTGVDKETYLPIYDDTYKDVLNQILLKFDDYEEQYAGGDVDGDE